MVIYYNSGIFLEIFGNNLIVYLVGNHVLRIEPEIEPTRPSDHGSIDSSGSTNGWNTWLIKQKLYYIINIYV